MNLSLRYFEVEPVEGPHMSEGLDQTLDEDVCVHNAPGSVERAFSILIVRSATKQDDLTTRARIRNAALDLFPEQGFNRSTVRVIAEKAGVSPGLVLHHFGSKEGLREACDRYVVTRFRELKDDSLQGGMFDPGFMSRSIGESRVLMRYLAWALTTDSPEASTLFDEMVAEAVQVTQRSIELGYIKGSADLESRTAIQLSMQLGLAVLHEHVQRVTGIDLFDEAGLRRAMPILLEIFSGRFEPDLLQSLGETIDRTA